MYSVWDHLTVGFPHSELHGSKPARGSPWLIAACHVLHRLSVPRHPPDALKTLDPFVTLSRRDKPTQQETQQTALSALQLSSAPFTQNNDRTRPSRLRGQIPCKAEPIRSHFTKPFSRCPRTSSPCCLQSRPKPQPICCSSWILITAQLSQTQRKNGVWWRRTGSNRRPEACKAPALPTDLWPPFSST